MSTATRTPEPRLLIDVPPGFSGIPITGSGEQITDHVRRLAEQMTAAQPEREAVNEEHLVGLTQFLVVTTTSETGWPAVAAEAMRVANSVRFEYPDDSRHDASEY